MYSQLEQRKPTSESFQCEVYYARKVSVMLCVPNSRASIKNIGHGNVAALPGVLATHSTPR